MKMKIKKNDEVIVISGKDKGKKGRVVKVIPADNKLIISGINMVTKHQKASQQSASGIVSKEAPIHASNVAIVDPKSGSATKIGYKVIDGKKVRFAKKSGEIIDSK
jgi:large subunit ribosomal protein L24